MGLIAASQPQRDDTIRTGGIVLVDKDGTETLRISGGVITDASGSTVATFGPDGIRARSFTAVGVHGGAAVTVGVGSGGAGSLATYNGSGQQKLFELSNTVEGDAYLAAYNASGQKLVELTSGVDGEGVLATYNTKGQELVALTSTAKGEGVLTTYNGRGQELVALTSTANGEGVLATYNGKGQTLVSLRSTETGAGSLTTYDAKGGPLLQLLSTPSARATVLANGRPLYLVGSIAAFAGRTVPPSWGGDWVPCDGRDLARDDYPELYAAIGTMYGARDSATFRVPDLRDQFLRGASASRSAGSPQPDAVHNGVERSLQQLIFQMRNHRHHLFANAALGSLRLYPLTSTQFAAWRHARGFDTLRYEVVGTSENPTMGLTSKPVFDALPANIASSLRTSYATETRPINVAVTFVIRAR
jgi:microcystin-dependent protein